MKKIIAMILAIAMTVSMFTMVFSADEVLVAEAPKTNYSEKVEQIGQLIEEFLAVGPSLDPDFNAYHTDAEKYWVNTTRYAGRGSAVSGVIGELDAFDFLDEDDYEDWYEVYGRGFELYISDEAAFIAALKDTLASIAFAFNGGINADGTFAGVVTESSPKRFDIRSYFPKKNDKNNDEYEWTTGAANANTTMRDKYDGLLFAEYLVEQGELDADLLTGNLVEKGLLVPSTAANNDAQQAVSYIVLFATYAYHFGSNADSDLFSAEFNANRVQIYDLAIKAMTKLMAALKAQVTNAVQPDAYAALIPSYVDFAEVNKDYYNASYGINPYAYLYKDVIDGDDLSSIIGINAGWKWVTFEEIQANPVWAELLADFQIKLATAKFFAPAGTLYPVFAEAKAALDASFKALCEAIALKTQIEEVKDFSFVKENLDAVMKLSVLYNIYEKYVAPNYDLYSKTIENSAVLYNLNGQLQFAKSLLDALGYYLDEGAGVYWFGYDGTVGKKVQTMKFEAGVSTLFNVNAEAVLDLVDSIEAGIEALVPTYGQELTAKMVADGTELVKKASALLAYTGQTHEGQYYKLVWDEEDEEWKKEDLEEAIALADALNTISNMLPYAAGENAVATHDVGVFYISAPNKDLHDLVYGKDAEELTIVGYDYNLEYAPVAYTYLVALDELAEAYEVYADYVSKLSFQAPEYAAADITEVYNALKPYEFLYWTGMKLDGNRIDSSPEYLKYFYALTGYDSRAAFAGDDVLATEDFKLGGFLGKVLSDTDSSASEQNVYDYAARNYLNFYTVLDAAFEIANNWDEETFSYIYGEDGKIDFSEGFDVLDVLVSNGASVLADLIEAVQAAAKLLCVNHTKLIVKYDWVLEQIEETFGITLADAEKVAYTYDKDSAPNAADPSIAQNYTEGTFKALVAAMTVLNQDIARYHDIIVKGEIVSTKEMVTTADLNEDYAAVVEALYALLTGKGQVAMDSFFAAVEETFTVTYDKISYNNPADVKTVLDNYVGDIVDYFPAVVMARPYEYFAYTINTIAHYNDAGNIYYANPDVENSPFELNFYNGFAKAVANVEKVITGQYAVAIREEAAKLAFFANDILNGMGSDSEYTFDVDNWNAMNMPLWYAQELVTYLNNWFATDAAAQSAAALAVKKAADLEPLIAEANAIQTGVLSAAAANNFIKAYEAAKQVSANAKGQALYIYSAEEIDAAALALKNALIAVYTEIGDTVYTVEDILAKVDAMVATVEARVAGSGIDATEFYTYAKSVKEALVTNYGSQNQRLLLNNVAAAAADVFEAAMNAAGVGAQNKAVKADKALYTAASYEAYVAAKEALDAVADVNAETADTYATAKAAYDAAYNALLKIADAETAAYLNAVEVLAAIQAKLAAKDEYTAESYAKLEAAVAALQAAVDSYASDADLQAAIVTVKVAEAMLETAPVAEVGTLDD